MEDTFGRLPTDLLKYVCLLINKPKITLDCAQNENPPKYSIIIELPIIGVSYRFLLSNPVFAAEREMLICDIERFPLEQLDFNCGQIFVDNYPASQDNLSISAGGNTPCIHFYTDFAEFVLDIQYLPQLQVVLEEYKGHLLSFCVQS